MSDIYLPDGWVMIRIDLGGEFLYKIFSCWLSGYTTGDHWRLNSGVKSCSNEDTWYSFEGYSGSVYDCQKKSYGTVPPYCRKVLDNIVSASDVITELNYQEMEEACLGLN